MQARQQREREIRHIHLQYVISIIEKRGIDRQRTLRKAIVEDSSNSGASIVVALKIGDEEFSKFSGDGGPDSRARSSSRSQKR